MTTHKLTNNQKTEFCNKVAERYGKECVQSETLPSVMGVIEYLLKRRVIKDIDAKQFLFIQMYPSYYAAHGSKTAAIEALRMELDLSKQTAFYLVGQKNKLLR